MAHIYNGILLIHKKEWNWVICIEVDGPRIYHTSEVSQKEQKKYHMLMHIHGIWESGTDEPSGRTGINTQI